MKKYFSQPLSLLFITFCVVILGQFSTTKVQAATCSQVTIQPGQTVPNNFFPSKDACDAYLNKFGGCAHAGDCVNGHVCYIPAGGNLVPGPEVCGPNRIGTSCGSTGETYCEGTKKLVCVGSQWIDSHSTCSSIVGGSCSSNGTTQCENNMKIVCAGSKWEKTNISCALSPTTCAEIAGMSWCTSTNSCITTDGVCPTSCTSDAQCSNTGGRKCAQGICTDLTSSPTNCGVVGKKCSTTEVCVASKCVPDANHQPTGVTTCTCGDGSKLAKGTSTCAVVCAAHGGDTTNTANGGSCSGRCCTATGTNLVSINRCTGSLVGGGCSDAHFTTQAGTVCLPDNFCGSMQLDIVDASGHDLALGGAAANGTSCNTTNGPVCLSLAISKPNPKVGESVSLTCGTVANATKYEFRIKLPDGTIQNLATTPADATHPAPNTSTAFTVASQGAYAAQCRICTGANGATCQQFESF